ncbi:MAG: glycosyltransferase family 2 protein [Anaerolineales bacterium]|nr:glycosyltransferase family 2 protein [Anaerolineales bacterium]
MINTLPSPRISAVSAILPAYNDYATIASMVLTTRKALTQVTDDYEIIVVNDGSSDFSAQILEELSQLIPELQVIHHPYNQGYGAALRSGFSAAAKEWVFYTDGDAQYNPLELIQLVQVLEGNIDLVNGYKISRSDPLYRIIIGWLYNVSIKFLFSLKLKDIDCDFRLIRRELFDRIKLESNSGAICLEMVKKFQTAGITFAETPIHHYHRPVGFSQFFNWRHLWRSANELIRLWWKLVIKQV